MVPLWVSLDFETRSRIDLKKQGVYRYAYDPSTEILCAAYAIDDGPVQIWHKGQPIPLDLLAAALDPNVYFRAWNASFERQVWNAKLGRALPIPLERWVCSAALAARAGLPRALGKAASFLKLPEQKLAGGPLLKALSVPQKDGTFNEATAEQRAALEEYCAQDVSTERGIFRALPPSGHPLERKIWLLDQRVNDRGVEIDTQLVYALRAVAASITDRLNIVIRDASNGQVPGVTALPKMKKWLSARGVDVYDGLDKGILRDLLLQDGLFPEVRAVLEARAEGNKSSLGKLDAMLRMQNPDGYARGSAGRRSPARRRSRRSPSGCRPAGRASANPATRASSGAPGCPPRP
jgi:DNA polymerase